MKTVTNCKANHNNSYNTNPDTGGASIPLPMRYPCATLGVAGKDVYQYNESTAETACTYDTAGATFEHGTMEAACTYDTAGATFERGTMGATCTYDTVEAAYGHGKDAVITRQSPANHPLLLRNRKLSGIYRFALHQSVLRVLLLLLLPVAFVGYAISSSYYTGFKATTAADTGKGLVYASTSTTAPTADSQYATTSEAEAQSSDLGGSSETKEYYAWAKPARGYAFDKWTITSSNSNNGVNPTSSMTQNCVTVTMTSNVKNGTNTGTAEASWKAATSYTVTYGVPVDGSYSAAYSYTTIVDGAFTTGEFNISMTESSTAASGQITSYAGDVVTVSSDASNFDGWYSDAALTTQLSTANSYTFTVSGATAVYAKFKPATKYYGKITAGIAEVPYSMPGGGTIYISDVAGTSGATFSTETQSVSQTSYNSDDTPPASVSQTFYLYAQPTDKRYVFRGWYDNATCTGTALSTNAEYTYTLTVSSKTQASPTTKNIYAAFDFNLYYMQVEVEPAVPGLGMVLVKDDNSTTPAYTDYTSHSEQFAYAYRLAPTANVYLYAKPKYGYKFSGWYDNADCTGTAVGTANPLTYAATGTSTDPMNPTIIPLYAKFEEDATTVNITYNLPDQTKGEYTASVLDIVEVDDEFVWTFTEVYHSIGKTGNTVQAQHKTDVLRLEASPKAGYGVTSWTIAGAAKTTPSQLYETSVTAAGTYGVTFGDAKPFLVCATTAATTGTAYSSLREALDNLGTNKKIVVVQNAYVPAGDYTIPSGVTLLVPYEETYKVEAATPTSVDPAAASNCKPYVTLTLASGAKLNVEGEISVATKQYATGTTSTQTGVRTYYGYVYMDENSEIILNSGSKLYAWGYISGEGEITAKSGATIYEMFQIQDFRGGTATVGMRSGVFPFSQYYIQNIETPLTLEYGASEIVRDIIYMGGSQYPSSINFVGKSGSLFTLTSGKITKKYDRLTDRMHYTLDGNAFLSTISLKVSSVAVNSSSYDALPLTSNMTIDVKSGASFTITQSVAVLPGIEINVNNGAKITVNSSKNLYIYDKDEWVGKKFVYSATDIKRLAFVGLNATNTYGAPYARTITQDAKIKVDGEIEISGALYTTSSGADICSSGGGKISFKTSAGTSTNTQQATQSGTSITRVNVPITSAKLHNGDDSYTATAGSVSGDQFIYSKTQEKWLKNPKTITWNANGGTTEASTMAYSQDAFLGALPAAYRDGYTLDGWYTAATGGTPIEPTTKVTATTTYHAHWTPCTYTIKYMDEGKAPFSGTHVDSPTAHPTTHTYGTQTTLNSATKTGYTFDGWYTVSTCREGTKVTTLGATEYRKDITLYAKWVEIPSETGDRLDIVDWVKDASGKVTHAVLNMNGYSSATAGAGWTIQVNGNNYTKDNRDNASENPAKNRTMKVAVGSLSADDNVNIAALGTGDAIESSHPYTVPYINEIPSGVHENSIVFIQKNTKLTVSSTTKVKEIYVAPGAELAINSGVTLTVSKLVLRTEKFSSAVLTNNGTLSISDGGQMYYSRIVSENSQAYGFAVPYEVTLSDVKFSNGKKATHGTHYALMEYNGATRAENGIGGNWQRMEGSKLTANKGYELLSSSAYYYELLFPVDYGTPASEISVTAYSGKATIHDQGWNYLCQPYTYVYRTGLTGNDPSETPKIAVVDNDNVTYTQYAPTELKPAMPFYYQAQTAGTLSFGSTFSFVSSASSAPRREAKTSSLPTQWIQLLYGKAGDMAEGGTSTVDETNIYLNTDKFTPEYETGYDVVKMSKTGRRPLLWSSVSCGDLAFAALPDEVLEAGIPLTVFSPEGGTMVFALEDNDF
ncbi:MAG: InlB B-repeat-containing protein, partial [Paludibacteraceae bacterium]|nr:InlB B-repeat-containing protein [Paludibacteraceae bacterium]